MAQGLIDHVPVQRHDADDEYHVCIPADVCAGCSNAAAGVWVPVSFCPEAKARLGELYSWED